MCSLPFSKNMLARLSPKQSIRPLNASGLLDTVLTPLQITTESCMFCLNAFCLLDSMSVLNLLSEDWEVQG